MIKQIKSSEYFKINIIAFILCLVPFIIGTIFYAQLPEQMVVRFGTSSQSNGYASKEFGAFGLPAIFLGVQFFMYVTLALDPKKRNASRPMQNLARLLVPILSIFTESLIIYYAFNKQWDMGMLTNLFVGVVFLIAGNLLPKCKHNYTIGFKIPTTLADDDNWSRTHRFAGFIWVICSILIIAASFINLYCYTWVLFLIMLFVPILYSALLAIWKNKRI